MPLLGPKSSDPGPGSPEGPARSSPRAFGLAGQLPGSETLPVSSERSATAAATTRALRVAAAASWPGRQRPPCCRNQSQAGPWRSRCSGGAALRDRVESLVCLEQRTQWSLDSEATFLAERPHQGSPPQPGFGAAPVRPFDRWERVAAAAAANRQFNCLTGWQSPAGPTPE